jgi:acyl carrier protein
MIEFSVAQQRVKDLLVGFPTEVTDAYLGFTQNSDPARLDIVILGVLQFYLAKKPAAAITTLPGSTRLVEDLGCDSLSMMDTVFMVESLLDIKLNDTELAQISTVDQLREHLRQRVGQKSAVLP